MNSQQMTEQLTSPSNYSINQNALKLNSSSSVCLVSPSQSHFGSNLKNNLVLFQQYVCDKNQNLITNTQKKQQVFQPIQIGKKKLTIQIDQNYCCPQNNYDAHRVQKIEKVEKSKIKTGTKFQKQSLYSFEQQDCKPVENIQIISPIQSKNSIKYYQLLECMKKLEDQHTYTIQSFKMLKTQCAQADEKNKKLQQKISNMQSHLFSKQSENEFKSNRIQFLEEKLKQKQQQNQKLKQLLQQKQVRIQQSRVSSEYIEEIQQKMKQKDLKIKELAKINQKLKNLNKDLIRQVKQSENKVRDLEKQIQNNVCIVTQENIHRLKQSSLKNKQKQNIQRHNGIHSHSHNHNSKQQRDSFPYHHNLNTTKQKQISFGPTSSINNNMGGRKSLEKKKSGYSNTISTGQLFQNKKINKIGQSSSSNTILNKKLLHK